MWEQPRFPVFPAILSLVRARRPENFMPNAVVRTGSGDVSFKTPFGTCQPTSNIPSHPVLTLPQGLNTSEADIGIASVRTKS